MGRMLDGRWIAHDLGPDERGRYVRRETRFRDRVTADGASGFAPEAGRYHLYASRACGWTHRVLLARELLGLTDAISVSWALPFMGEDGWTFDEDAELGIRHVHEVYRLAKSDYSGRCSVPVLWDRERRTIVSNESVEIVAMLDTGMRALATRDVRLHTERPDVAAMIAANYGPVSNGVYRAGFAGNQEAHAEAVLALFARLDELEELLGRQRYLCGDALTAADLCLFPTLFRFDAIYHLHFKCNLRQLREYPALWAYTRDIYQHPGVAGTCDLEHAKRHYYTSHESISPRRIVPLGPLLDFAESHGREAFGG